MPDKSIDYAHLHNHSYYSLLDGLSSTKDLAEVASELGFKALALTDHGTCSGLYRFQQDCLKKDIKPILGMEGYITDDALVKEKGVNYYHILLIAKNKIGMRNLMQLSTYGEIHGKYRKPRIDFEILKKHKDGLIVTSACCIGEIATKLWAGKPQEAREIASRYKDLFGDDFYIEIMMHDYDGDKTQQNREKKLANELYKLAKDLEIKAICTNDTHYARKTDWEHHDVLLAMQTQDTIKNPNRKMCFHSKDFYLKPYEEMEQKYGQVPSLLTNTWEIVEKIIDEPLLAFSPDLLPDFNLPKGFKSENDYLKHLVKEGMVKNGFINKPEYRKRIKYEMSVITKCGFEKYFLILWDVINFANKEKIRVGIGRGCFLPDNLVLTKDGEKAVQDVSKKDLVLSFDGEFHNVLNTMRYEVDEEIFDIEMEDGRLISCTSDHKIHIVSSDGSLKWVEAKNLTENDEIYDINVGLIKMAKIKKISKRNYTGSVYDLSIDGVQAYNIDGLSVHNSGPSSLCLYCLGVTKIDPLKHELIFERFLNPERVSPPDVDIDFDDKRRDEIFNYMLNKYGEDHCTKIGTYGSLKAKNCIQYGVKALDLGNDWEIMEARKKANPSGKLEESKNSLRLAMQLSKMIPDGPDVTLEDSLRKEDDFKMAMAKYPKLTDHLLHIEGCLNSAGKHAAGIIVCKDPIENHLPLRDTKGVVCSQFDKDEVEELGFLKLDFLGLKTLSVIDHAVKLIKERHNIDLDVDTLEPDDQKIFDIFSGLNPRMDTNGIFQFESYGMKRLLHNIRVDRFKDIVLANALYRPGPLGAGVHDLYCEIKRGRQKPQMHHPLLKEALKGTYGVIITQEDVMKVTQVLAGFTGGQADIVRKAMGKKKPELLTELRGKFVAGCKKTNNIDAGIANKIFDDIDKFGGYGFNVCLSGDTTIRNKIDDKIYTLQELADGSYGINKNISIVLDSFKDEEVVEDDLVEVFETGEKEIFEVELDNEMIIKCTMEHKFYCSDREVYTLQEIIDEELEILYKDECIINQETYANMQKCKVKSVKSLGKQKTYNVTMSSSQHNYKIVNNGMGVFTKNSHSASYAFLAYQCAYLKLYYPVEFMASLLSSEVNDEDKLNIYLKEAEKMGIKAYASNINKSTENFEIDKNDKGEDCLLSPLSAIKGVGGKAVMSIVENQPFSDLEDFLRRIDTRKVNIRIFKALLDAGSMDRVWGMSRKEVEKHYAIVRKQLGKERKKVKKEKEDEAIYGEGSLFDNDVVDVQI